MQNVSNMKNIEKGIPYCGNCSRKIKKEGMSKVSIIVMFSRIL